MIKEDIIWVLWGICACIAFGFWQESLWAGLFLLYGTIFVLITIVGWDD